MDSSSGCCGWGHLALFRLVRAACRVILGCRMALMAPRRWRFHVDSLYPHPSWYRMGLNGRGYSRVMDSATVWAAACLRCWSRV